MEGEVLRDDQWEQIEQFVPGGASQPDLEWLMIDATVIRAQSQAAGARRKRGDLKPRLSAARGVGSAPSFMLS